MVKFYCSFQKEELNVILFTNQFLLKLTDRINNFDFLTHVTGPLAPVFPAGPL